MTASAQPLSATKLLAPIATMSDYMPTGDHPRIDALRRRVQLVIKGLRRIEVYSTGEEDDTEGQRAWLADTSPEEILEGWRIALDHMRKSQLELENGLGTRRFFREVHKYAKDMLPQLEGARQRAIAALKEHRAFAAMMADEDDDEDLGIEILPAMPEPGLAPRGPSRPYQW